MDFSNIHWQQIGHFSLIMLCSLAFLILVALPVMSIAGQTLSLIRQRTAYAKCAKQITLYAIFVGWIITFLSFIPLWLRVAPVVLKHLQDAEKITPGVPAQGFSLAAYLEPVLASIYLQVHLYTVALLLAATILMSIFYAFWSAWKEHRLLLQSLAIIASCWYAMAIYCILCIFHADTLFAQGIAYPLLLDNFLTPSLDASFWLILPYLLPLAFALAGGSACIWLLMRRSRDDFGRDYYAQMLVWCAKWARNGWFLFWVILLGITGLDWVELLKQENYLTNTQFLRSIAFVLMWLIPGILWTVVIKSAHPLRHKITLVFTFILGMSCIIPLYLTI